MVLYHAVGYHTRPLRLREDHYLISARVREQYEREQEVVEINDAHVLIAESRPRSDVFEAIDRIILYVARKAPHANDYVPFDPAWDYPIGLARDGDELKYLLEKAIQMELLEHQGSWAVRLGLAGWKRVGQLRVAEPDATRAFVAMRFTEELRPAFEEGFQPALLTTGFSPLRIDLVQHNDKIDDRIIAEIRKCGLLVADFTGQRQNVYFEAGFALGLARQVIWSCREAEVRRLHFDIRQYNFVVWRDPGHLREMLRARIEATMPPRSSSRELARLPIR
jgi:hypothetical protein